jgi:hypothetical protein
MHKVHATTFAQLFALLSLLVTGAQTAGETLADYDDAGDSPAQPDTSAAQAEAVPSQADAPDSADGSSAMEPVETPPPTRRKRLVYACRDAAAPVFSDRPCGASADAYRLDLPTPPASGAAPSTRPAAPAAATRPIIERASGRDAAAPPNPCTRLEAQLTAIDARMRDGYSAREAARLWQRWRDAKAKLRAAHC